MNTTLFELPKVYLIALWAAAFLHLFFMEREECWMVAYFAHPEPGITIVGSARLTVSSFSMDDVREALCKNLEAEHRKPFADKDLIVNNVQRLSLKWKWKPFWRGKQE